MVISWHSGRKKYRNAGKFCETLDNFIITKFEKKESGTELHVAFFKHQSGFLNWLSLESPI